MNDATTRTYVEHGLRSSFSQACAVDGSGYSRQNSDTLRQQVWCTAICGKPRPTNVLGRTATSFELLQPPTFRAIQVSRMLIELYSKLDRRRGNNI